MSSSLFGGIENEKAASRRTIGSNSYVIGNSSSWWHRSGVGRKVPRVSADEMTITFAGRNCGTIWFYAFFAQYLCVTLSNVASLNRVITVWQHRPDNHFSPDQNLALSETLDRRNKIKCETLNWSTGYALLTCRRLIVSINRSTYYALVQHFSSLMLPCCPQSHKIQARCFNLDRAWSL